MEILSPYRSTGRVNTKEVTSSLAFTKISVKIGASVQKWLGRFTILISSRGPDGHDILIGPQPTKIPALSRARRDGNNNTVSSHDFPCCESIPKICSMGVSYFIGDTGSTFSFALA